LQNDYNVSVRRRAAWALGKIGTPEAIKAAEGEVPVLIQTLQDQDADVRASAADVLGQIGESVKDKNSFVIVDAVPALIQALQNDYNVRVRSRTAMALGDIRSEDAVPVLVQALQDENLGVCRSSERALRKIGTSEALKAVEEYQSRQ